MENTIPTENQPAPIQLQSSPTSSKLLIPLIVVVVCLLIGVGGVLAYFKLIYPPVVTPSALPNPIPTQVVSAPTPTSTQIPANWKTYDPSNMNVNILFKYPPNWQIKEPISPQDTAIAYFHSGITISPEEEYYFYVTPTKGLPNVKLSKDIINGYTVYKTDKLPSRSGELSYFITNNDSNYIQLALDPYNESTPFSGQEEIVQTFDQILSTFKFTDSVQAVDTSNWKTYGNSQLGFTVQYPSDWSVSKIGGGSDFPPLNAPDGISFINFDKGPIGGVSGNESLTNYCQTRTKIIVNMQEHQLMLNGVQGIYCLNLANPNPVINVMVQKDKQQYEISATINSQNKDQYLTLFDQILSTFKFTSL